MSQHSFKLKRITTEKKGVCLEDLDYDEPVAKRVLLGNSAFMQKLPRYVDIDQIVALVGRAQAFKTAAAAKTTPIEQKRFLNDGLFLNK